MKRRIDETTWLRSVATSDAEPIFARVDAQREHLGPWLPWVALTHTAADTLQFIQRSIAEEDAGTGLAAVIEDAEGVSGVIGFNTIDPANRSAELGYWLRKELEGRGLATRAVSVMLEHGFGALDLHRICIRAAPTNTRSRAIPERLRFRQEGIHREAERFGDRFRDIVCYALLRPEFEASRAHAAREPEASS